MASIMKYEMKKLDTYLMNTIMCLSKTIEIYSLIEANITLHILIMLPPTKSSVFMHPNLVSFTKNILEPDLTFATKFLTDKRGFNMS